MERLSKQVFIGLLLALSMVGALEVYNKMLVGSVMRPWVQRIYIDPSIQIDEIPGGDLAYKPKDRFTKH